MEIKKFSEMTFDKVNEVLIHPDFSTVTEDGHYIIIALQKFVYFCEWDNDEIIQNVAKNINKTLNIKFKLNIDNDFLSIVQEIKDYLPNVLVFDYDMNNSNTLNFEIINEFQQDINSSKYFIDVLKFLKEILNINTIHIVESIENVDGSDSDMLENYYIIDTLIEEWEKDIKYRKLAKYVYHGTSLKYLKNILNVGLRPNLSNSNYMHITHKNRIFLTSDKTNAMFHANKAARNTNAPPIILKIDTTNLDLSKIDFDYDFYVNYISDRDNFMGNNKTQKNYNPKTLSHLKNKYIGSTYRKFSYIGSILPKNIIEIYYNLDNNYFDFDSSINKEEFKDFLEMYDYLRDITDMSCDKYVLDKSYYEEIKQELEEEDINELGEIQENRKILLFEDHAKKGN